MTSKEYYEFFRSEHSKANKLAKEVVAMARERKVSIPMLVKSICEDYASSEADIASRGAYGGGYEHGLSDGRNAERLGW